MSGCSVVNIDVLAYVRIHFLAKISPALGRPGLVGSELALGRITS